MGRVLVADDEEGVRSFLVEALERGGHEVVPAADGDEALATLQREAFDLLLTDLKMPGLDGMALLARVRSEQPDLEVVVLTAHGTVDVAVEAMRAGAFDFLQKPIGSPAELRLVVERALEHRRLRTAVETAERTSTVLPTLGHGDPAMEPVEHALRKVARTDATVLLMGESGTGKEVAARAVHAWSDRAAGPFMAINCAALTKTLLESELFGHEKGAFTGAHARHRGRIELAVGGTFFLDEVGELQPELQAKLLRVLEQRQFERVGGTQTIRADVRWVAATNRDLSEMIAAGEFREDLYHRLAVFPVRLPPLRERPADIVPLALELLHAIASDIARGPLTLGDGVAEALRGAPWSGNVRELRNALERAAILADGDTIERDHLFVQALGHASGAGVPAGAQTLEEVERAAIEAALAAVGGNRRQAAERLGIGLRTLYDKLKKYDLGQRD